MGIDIAAAVALVPLIQALIKAAMENRKATAKEIAESVAHLNTNEIELDALITQIETDPVLADLVAKRHGGNTEPNPSTNTDVPPLIENV